ncbi:MAG: diguanylate cyclase [Nitrospinae bacterium]|nr:diguanylate cyclase [Nitrospinota bacterium]
MESKAESDTGVTGYIFRNLEDIFILFILVSVTLSHLFFHFSLSLLNLYYVPIMLAGYLLGKRLVVLYAFFIVLLVWGLILANGEIYNNLKSLYGFNIDLTLWGGFLILAGWAGSLSENLKDELRTSDLLRKELARDKEELKTLNEKLVEVNRKLEEKIEKKARELEHSNEELKRLSWTDPLTQLLNRRSCEERFKNEIARFERTNESFCIILCDLDHFKSINDTYGHNTGDYVLIEVARILKSNSRKTDMVFRWGGEEFLVLLTGTELKGGIIAGEKIRIKIETTVFEHDQQVLPITMSMGISIYQKGQLMEECVKKADENLYSAKKAGRNRLHPQPFE